MTRTYTTTEITENKFSALEEISKSINAFIDGNSDYPSVLLLNKSAKRKFEKELATTLEESQLDYYKLNKIDRKSTRLNSSHRSLSRMPSSA